MLCALVVLAAYLLAGRPQEARLPTGRASGDQAAATREEAAAAAAEAAARVRFAVARPAEAVA